MKKETNEWENVPNMEPIPQEHQGAFDAFMEVEEFNESQIPVDESVKLKRTKTRSKNFYDDEILFIYPNGDIHLKDGVKRKEYINDISSYDEVDETDAYVPIELIDNNKSIDYDNTSN